MKIEANEPPLYAPWLERARWREQNQDWLSDSFMIAIFMLESMEKKDMTREELADRLNVSQEEVDHYLSGRHNFNLKEMHMIQKELEIKLRID